MGQYDHIFTKIGNAKARANYLPKIGVGTHRLALKRYAVKASTNPGGGPILEADFIVVASTSHPIGEARGWAWFVSQPGWGGTYEEERAKEFLGVVGACINDTRGTDAIGLDLSAESQPGTGLVIDVTVTPKTNRDGSPQVGKKGEVYVNANWVAVTQSLEDIAAMAAKMAAAAVAVPVAAATPAPAAAPIATPFAATPNPVAATANPFGTPTTSPASAGLGGPFAGFQRR